MTKKERLTATLNGKPVDRPAVSFYELDGLTTNPNDSDPFNIFSDPSWKPLLDLTSERTDKIVNRAAPYSLVQSENCQSKTETKTFLKNGSRFTIKKIHVDGKILVSRTRQDQDVFTVWTEEHLLKNVDDLKTFLKIPPPIFDKVDDVSHIIDTEKTIGDDGIVLLDTADPLCLAAALFNMAEYTVIALTEQKLFHQLLEYFASFIIPGVEAIAKALPGRLWRIYGPEYASPPYLPPYLFREYVCKYVQPMINAIQKYDGYARIHSHGNLKLILDDIADMGADGLDPIEPPPQGDVTLKYVRENYGKDLVLFGNLEIADIENMPTEKFSEKVKIALDEGTSGEGRGFVLMPSASPYGKKLSSLTLKNYEKIIELVERF